MDEESLFPEDIDDDLGEDIEEDEEESVVGYKIAPYFDSKSGDFLLNGSGQIVDASEIDAYAQWCENVIATDRYNHGAYTDDIGLDYDEIFSADSREEAEAVIESEIAEALECDPFGRTQYVQNVSFEWIGADEVNVLVEVIALDNELVTIDTVITR